MSDQPTKPHGRIFVSAIACEKVLVEAGEMLTPVRLFTAFKATPLEISYQETGDGPAVTRKLPQPGYFSIVVLFVSEKAESFVVTLKGTKPDGSPLDGGPKPMSVSTAGGFGGASLVYALTIPSDQEGVFWLDIYLDDELVSKVPILIFHDSPPEAVLASPQSSAFGRS